MSELFDRLVESAGQVISEVDKGGQIQSAIGGLRQRMAEAERKRKINQIKRQIRDLQSQETQSINALSSQVLALHEAGTLSQPELLILCKAVDEIREQIKQSEAELEQLQPPPPQPVVEVRCPSCGITVVSGAAFCQTCGTTLAQETDAASEAAPVHFCVHCGAQLRSGARFCPKCGQTVPPN
jgi:membrane protease subunit (stomatin/prohibitin family)